MMIDEELDGMRALIAIKDPGRFGFAGKLLAHIDEQSGQIVTLKSICIQERNRYLVDFVHEYDDVMDCKEEAKKQLAQEYPGIEWEEMK